MPRRYLFSFLMIALGSGSSPCQSCSAWESQKTISGSSMAFRLDPYPWKVTADLDANVTIENTAKKSTCKTKLESVISVYLGSSNLIYFRSSEISNDELFTLDGLSCREARKAQQLSTKSEADTARLLRSLGICSRK